jgi:putative peptidoglycan lipid II flippase
MGRDRLSASSEDRQPRPFYSAAPHRPASQASSGACYNGPAVDEFSTLEERRLARAAGLVMAGFVLSNLTGLAKWVLVSNAFGTQFELDAFNAANRLPELLFSVMAGGALASAFVPVFTSFIARDNRAGAWRLASAVANWVFLAMSLAAGAAWLAAPWLVPHVLAPGFGPAETQLTVSLLRILLISAVIFGLSGMLMGVLNAQGHFLLPALAPSFLWLGWIFGVLFLAPKMGIFGLAWGVVLGAGLHLAVQLPGLRGRTARYHLALDIQDPAVRQVGRLMAPRLVGQALIQLNFLVNVILASTMAEGSLTAINYAFFIMLMPQAIIAQAIAIAALPTFSAQVARDDLASMRGTLATTLRGVVFLALPATIGLVMLREPIVAMLFQRGQFTAHSTDLVAWALLWYGLGLVSHSLVEIVSRAFYALQDTLTPVTVGGLAMAVNIGLSFGLASLFTGWNLPPHGGLALANTLATTLEASALLVLMRRRLGGLDLARIKSGLLSTIVASLVLAGVVVAWILWNGSASVWLVGLGGVVLGGAAFWLVALALRAPEARQLPGVLLKREET